MGRVLAVMVALASAGFALVQNRQPPKESVPAVVIPSGENSDPAARATAHHFSG